MLYAMEAELQKRFERMSAYEIITDLKSFLHYKLGLKDMKLLKLSSQQRWMSIAVLVST